MIFGPVTQRNWRHALPTIALIACFGTARAGPDETAGEGSTQPPQQREAANHAQATAGIAPQAVTANVADNPEHAKSDDRDRRLMMLMLLGRVGSIGPFGRLGQ